MTITVLDANDNTPTFANVSYSVNLFTDILPGETVIEVQTSLEICGLTLHFMMLEWNCASMVQHFCVFQLSAIDSDAGPNGQVNYRILAGDQGHFLIGTRSIKGRD